MRQICILSCQFLWALPLQIAGLVPIVRIEMLGIGEATLCAYVFRLRSIPLVAPLCDRDVHPAEKVRQPWARMDDPHSPPSHGHTFPRFVRPTLESRPRPDEGRQGHENRGRASGAAGVAR